MHIIEAEIEVQVQMDENGIDVVYPQIEIVYSYLRGSPAVMYQRNGDPGWPAEGPELEVMDVTLTDDAGLDPDAKQLMAWAEEWLHGAGYYKACENAEEDHED
jgi:hypothetical protein